MPGAEDFLAFLSRNGCKPGTATAYLRVANRIHSSGLSGAAWLEDTAKVPDTRRGEPGTAKKTVGMFRAAVSYYEAWKHPKQGTRREVSMRLLSANAFRRGEERQPADAEDVKALEARVAEELSDVREPLLTILSILSETGARIAEVCGLQLGDVDWTKRELILHGKRGKTRRVPATEELLSTIRRYVVEVRALAEPPGGHLFYGKLWLTPIWTTGLNRDLRKYKRPDGQGYFTPHQVRHLVATDLVEGGTALPVVRDILGHDNIGTLNPYLKSSREAQREALSKRARNKQRGG